MARKVIVQQLYSPQLAQLQWLLRLVNLDERIAPSEVDKVAEQVDALMQVLMRAQMKPLPKQPTK
jgi:hypothetical protein